MKKVIILALVAAFLAGGAAVGGKLYFGHQRWQTAYDQARYDFAKAWGHRDDSSDLYLKLAEGDVSYAESVSPQLMADRRKTIKLRTCVSDMEVYRTVGNLASLDRKAGRLSANARKLQDVSMEQMGLCAALASD